MKLFSARHYLHGTDNGTESFALLDIFYFTWFNFINMRKRINSARSLAIPSSSVYDWEHKYLNANRMSERERVSPFYLFIFFPRCYFIEKLLAIILSILNALYERNLGFCTLSLCSSAYCHLRNEHISNLLLFTTFYGFHKFLRLDRHRCGCKKQQIITRQITNYLLITLDWAYAQAQICRVPFLVSPIFLDYLMAWIWCVCACASLVSYGLRWMLEFIYLLCSFIFCSLFLCFAWWISYSWIKICNCL